ncbi:uncharacterized protein LOC130696639 isoform X2 [Daphnia carinata]|uniref:uncharacterized protein LOC130696639 isoform X2 n=1 Tax=Daphnia carinata TaxID=120202 RepID=UPI00257CD950|nr:uncharacterized protein LOC130696639 isoform X2 [Daphnia carinata]
MVRDIQYSDESESDWDSLSQAVPPPTTVESTQPSLAQMDERPKLARAFNETIPSSSDSFRSTHAAKGPLTFIDRQLESDAVVSQKSTRESSPVVTLKLKNEEPNQVHQTTEAQVLDFGVIAADIKDVELRPIQSKVKLKSPVLATRRRNNSMTYSESSDAFDNLAFEDANVKSSPSRVFNNQSDEIKTATIQQPLPKPDETIEIFAYDKTNTEFNQVSERRRRAKADGLSEAAFELSSRFCSEVTTVIGLPFVIVLAVLLQSLRFVTAGLLRPLLIGLVMGISDGLLKPLLAALHNGVVVPLATFLHNVGSALKTSLIPLAGIVGLMTEPIGRLLRSCRLIDIHQHHHKPIMRDV